MEKTEIARETERKEAGQALSLVSVCFSPGFRVSRGSPGMFMHLQRTFDGENRARAASFLIPLTLTLSHPGEGIFWGMTAATSVGRWDLEAPFLLLPLRLGSGQAFDFCLLPFSE